MKKIMYFTISIIGLLLCIGPIYSEEPILSVSLNKVEITKQTEVGTLVNQANLEIKTPSDELFSTLEILIMQDGNVIQIPFTVQKETKTISAVLPIGKNYTMKIQGSVNEEKYIWRNDHTFTIVKPVSIMMQDKELREQQILFKDSIVTIHDYETIQMDKSYIMLHGEQKAWDKKEDEYVFEIHDVGKYDIEFHFVDADNNEFTQIYSIMKEREKILTTFFIQEEEVSLSPSFYKEEKLLEIKVAALDKTNLKVFDNAKEQSVEWMPIKDGFHTYVKLFKEGSHNIQVFYAEDTQDSLLKEQVITIDSITPNVYVTYDKQDYYANDVIINVQVEDSAFDEGSYITDNFNTDEIHYQNWQQNETGYQMQIIVEKEGEHLISIHCFDKAGNVSEIYQNDVLITDEITFYIDKTPPLVQSNIRNQASSVFSQNQKVQLFVKDEHIDMDSISVEVNRNQTPYSVSIHTLEQYQQALIEFILEEDGCYEISASASDYVKNTYTMKPMKLTIDQTIPKVSLRNLGNEITNQNVIIETYAFDEFIDSFYMILKRDGILLKEESYFENMHETMEFHEDEGTHTYEIFLKGVDTAGNENQTVLQFVIDKDTPIIQSFLKNAPYTQKVITNQSLDISFLWNDSNLDKAELLQYKNGELIDQFEINDSFYKKRCSSLASRKDEYQYYVRVYDKAGNRSESRIDFTMDTELPQLKILQEVNGVLFNQAWIPTVSQTNKAIQVKDTLLLRNQKEVPYVWGTPVEEDGYYQLFMTIEDEAGNINRIPPIRFEIDTTAPIIQTLHKKTKEELKQTYIGTPFIMQIDTGFLHKDNITSIIMDDIELVDKDVSTYDVELVEGNHHMFIRAMDRAGNISEKEMDFTITSTPASPINKHLLWGLVLAAALGVLVKKISCFF